MWERREIFSEITASIFSFLRLKIKKKLLLALKNLNRFCFHSYYFAMSISSKLDSFFFKFPSSESLFIHFQSLSLLLPLPLPLPLLLLYLCPRHPPHKTPHESSRLKHFIQESRPPTIDLPLKTLHSRINTAHCRDLTHSQTHV